MRVLFLDQFSESGGAQFCLRDLILEIGRRGWECELMAPGDGPLHESCHAAGVPSHSLPVAGYSNGRKRAADVARFPFDMACAAAAVSRRVRQFRPHLVYVNGPRVLPAVVGRGCPVVFHAHSLLNRRYAQNIVRWRLGRGDTTVIATSRHVAQALGSSPSPVIIYNGVEDQGFVSRPRPRARDSFHVGIVGRIAPEKGQLEFVHAARRLAGSDVTMRFSITGATMFSDPAYEAQVRLAAEGLPVEFRGWTADVRDLLHDLDVIAVPSTAIDATPRVVMEALSAGTPIVACRSGGMEELLVNGKTGILTESRSPVAIARAIGMLAVSPRLTARLSSDGRREWEVRFRLERYRRNICDLIERIAMDGRLTETSEACCARE